jgi:hypothetical protein
MEGGITLQVSQHTEESHSEKVDKTKVRGELTLKQPILFFFLQGKDTGI